jgi:hypothetical protein
MHSPHSMQPRRGGPAPPKYGSGTSTPGSCAPSRPKNTPTRVGLTVSPRPNSSATRRMTTSLGVMLGWLTTPSIRLAWA